MTRRPPLQIAVPESAASRALRAADRAPSINSPVTPGSGNSSPSGSASAGADSGQQAQVLAVFRRYDLQENGAIGAAGLAAILSRLDGGRGHWTAEKVAPLMEAAGGLQDGRVRIGDFIAWVFCSQSPTGSTPASTSRVGSIAAGAAEEDCRRATAIERASRKASERVAGRYAVAVGERLYRPRSHSAGLLLLRPNRSFAYVHDAAARFSEGVQGEWRMHGGNGAVELNPKSFGFCYQESFDVNEVIGVRHVVRPTEERSSEGGVESYMVDFTDGALTSFSWLDPNLPEAGVDVGGLAIHDDLVPTSPKVPSRVRRSSSKRASGYRPDEAERLYRPRSHPGGLLLLSSGNTFSYVHDDTARFGDGVQGTWSELGDGVELEPTAFGFCYEDRFDAADIIGVRCVVALTGERCSDGAACVCDLPAPLLTEWSWLNPTLEQAARWPQGADDAAAADFCPNSPKVPARRRKGPEKRAEVHVASEGDRLFRPRSHQAGVLLLRSNSTFAYVHDDKARFSEGIQGDWKEQSPDRVVLDPQYFGYCYEDSFDSDEIIGVQHTVILRSEKCSDGRACFCELPEALTTEFSWLNPTLQEPPSHRLDEVDFCPNSPKVPSRGSRRNPEKRAKAYRVAEGELLYRPRSYQLGVLLLRPNGTFSYVHTDDARFSEGVEGEYVKLNLTSVELRPSSVGYCYLESFDEDEIIGRNHVLRLCEDECGETTGAKCCELPERLLTELSWLNPTLADKDDAVQVAEDSWQPACRISEVDFCPNSPKVPSRSSRRNAEKRAKAYRAAQGEQLYRPRSYQVGVLLLRPDGTFSYVHNDDARFSEGVGGDYTQLNQRSVELRPSSVGYCYMESFDEEEIIGKTHVITLCDDACGDNGAKCCELPEPLLTELSWLDPTLAEPTNNSEEQPLRLDDVDFCPNSPKVVRGSRRNPEKRAKAYRVAEGERLYRPRSHQAGVLLLRPDGTFSYVHVDDARFSEGVGGEYAQLNQARAELRPSTVGYCYMESFDEDEIIGNNHVITLCEDQCGDNGAMFCELSGPLLTEFSWLNPTLADTVKPVKVDDPPIRLDDVDLCPNSPKVVRGSRRNPEKRAKAYRVAEGERLYRPRSYQVGLLLLRQDGTFSYVHTDDARFSEGVGGEYVQVNQGSVELRPSSVGYCYMESFDEDEIIGKHHVITLCDEVCDDTGAKYCDFSAPLLTDFSWLNPTLTGTAAAATRLDDVDFCPNSPKVPAQSSRRNAEKRAKAYRAGQGERLYRPRSYQVGVLLLRPDGTFSYVHDSEARFSEGVGGKYVQLNQGSVELIPTSVGYCYMESFDEEEIIGKNHVLTLRDDACGETGACFCEFREPLLSVFSWLNPTLEDVEAAAAGGEEECPNSPKIARTLRRNAEKVASKYALAPGERLYRPRSHAAGLLLLRPDQSFAYVHDAAARFSEGVQGEWRECGGAGAIELRPTSFGFCYQESFDDDEIIGVCYVVVPTEERSEGVQKSYFVDFTGLALSSLSWLDPTLPELDAYTNGEEEAEICPNSPKVPSRQRRGREKRAEGHVVGEGERLFRPRSHQAGVLLLRSNGTFAYVHDAQARFSEGVQGDWKEQGSGAINLDPQSFGYCYEDGFDADEIIGVHHTVFLCEERCDDGKSKLCDLPEALLTEFSWLNPTLSERPALGLEDEDFCPNSPKVPSRGSRRNQEKRAKAYRLSEGERLFRPRSYQAGVLLLRPDGSFAYVHDGEARFSDGVAGDYEQLSPGSVELRPSSIGYCFMESFDEYEILGKNHVVALCDDACGDTGARCCELPAPLLTTFSWLNPTLEEGAATSPKVAARPR